jgi:hypothetical protein
MRISTRMGQLQGGLHPRQTALQVLNLELRFNFLPIEKIDAFSAESIDFSCIFSALKVKRFQSNVAIFFTLFFTNSENATKSKFRKETLNILSALKFTESHLAYYE